MRRILASVLVQALVVSSTMVAPMHVHAYTDHDHATHHHGPASHEHHHPAADRDHHETDSQHDRAVLIVESCDPGRHAVSVTMACAQLAPVHLDLAELPGPVIAATVIPLRSATNITDVRVHGPPSRSSIGLRAPPLNLHA